MSDQNPDRPRKQSDAEKLVAVISLVAHEVCRLREQMEKEFEWRKSHHGLATKQDLREMETRIMASQAELTADLKAVLVQQQKTSGEIATLQASVDAQTVKIAELEALVAAGGTISQELIDAVAAVKAQAQIIDDQIPDVVPPPPVE